MPTMLDDHEEPGAGAGGAVSVGADVTAPLYHRTREDR